MPKKLGREFTTKVLPPLPAQWYANITQPWGAGQNVGPNGEGGHTGTDYGCPAGTPIYSIADGVVIYAGYADGFGYHAVCIWHPTLGVATTSGHAQKHLVEFGDEVAAGEQIAEADSQGYSSGNHLHHEVRTVYSAFGGNPPNVNGDAFIKYCMDLQQKKAEGEKEYKLTASDRTRIKKMQEIFGLKQTGMWCVAEDNAMKTMRTRAMNAPTVRREDVRLIQWKFFEFGSKDVTQKWSIKTEQAYQLLRYMYLYK